MAAKDAKGAKAGKGNKGKQMNKCELSRKDEALGAAFFAVKLIARTHGVKFETLVESLVDICEGKIEPKCFY